MSRISGALTSVWRSLVVLGLHSLVCVPAAGAAADPLRRDVTLDQALAATTSAPEHEVAERKTSALRRAADASGAWEPTELLLSSNLRTARFAPMLRVPLPVWGTLSADRRRARDEVAASVAEESDGALDLRMRVKLAWVELYRAEAGTALAVHASERQAELARIAARRFDAGDVPRADVVAAEAQSRRLRAEASAAGAAIYAASAALAGLLGWSLDVKLHAEGELPQAREPPPLATLVERARRHPRVRAAAARAKALGARVEQSARERWPQIFVELEAMIDDPTLPGSDFRAGIGAALPILGRRNEAEAAAEAERQTALAELAAEANTVAARSVSAYHMYEAARERARALRDEVLPAQREAAQLARTAYVEGYQNLISVIDAERTLDEIERETLDAAAEAAIAGAELEASSGGVP